MSSYPQSAQKYFQNHHINQVLESIVAGLTYSQPPDPLGYIEDCVQKIRKNDLPFDRRELKWDVFIPPPEKIAPVHKGEKSKKMKPLRGRQSVHLPPLPGGRDKEVSLEGISKPIVPRLGLHSAGHREEVKKAESKPLPPIGPKTGQSKDNVSKDRESSAKPMMDAAIRTNAEAQVKLGKAWENIVFVLGGPGCGKGTQCALISRDYNYTHLSAGDLLRAEVSTGSDLGKQLDSMMKEGKIVPMEVTIKLLRQAMEKAPLDAAGFLIDGFPRELDQALAFEDKVRYVSYPKCYPPLQRTHRSVQVASCRLVLYYSCPEELLERRLLKRGETSGRADDNIETIRKRFRVFLDKSLPVIQHYGAVGKCVEISSENSVDAVYAETRKHFDKPKPLYHSNVVFVLGGPGSGKGTQSTRLADEFSLTHLSTGDLLRAEIVKKSSIGKECAELMQEGKMVPMRLVLGLVRAKMEEAIAEGAKGFLIDGFPRTVEQALEFEETIGPPATVLYFSCPLTVLEARLLERGKTSGRADDNMETIRKRFRTFEQESLPVVEYYKGCGKCVEVSGNGFDILGMQVPKKVSQIVADRQIDDVYQEARRVFLVPEPLGHPNINFVLGGPGSGKGTQCVRLAQRYGLLHVSTGDLLRREVEDGTEVGKQVGDYMSRGVMVPMKTIMELLVKKVEEEFDSKGFLIDGFPRTVDQALTFERLVGSPSRVLYFSCPLDVLERRLLERGKTSGRADDTLETIKQRFATYQKESLPVVQYYKDKGVCVEIESTRSVEQVFEVACRVFESEEETLQPANDENVESAPEVALESRPNVESSINEVSSSTQENAEQVDARPFDGEKIVFVLGGPGSGKGTQCLKLVEELGWAHLSTGDLLREEVKKGTPLGQQLEADMREGKMVPMSITIELLKNAMGERHGAPGYLIDGFPRTMEQAEVFERSLAACTFVLFFDAPKDVLTSRLLKRGETSGRADDNAESIGKRLSTFDEQSMPVIEFFERDGRVKRVIAEGTIEEITRATMACFEGI
ncbi:hypothetical protein HDU85_001039 [Gaertneriomyces sp. JEL0708]|nr:hypothetical protein HDU85_001039 [Gaertneriomyces sp. JEL0708]